MENCVKEKLTLSDTYVALKCILKSVVRRNVKGISGKSETKVCQEKHEIRFIVNVFNV